MATFLQLQNRVYANIRDPGKTFVLLQEVKDWINEAQLEIATRLRCLDEEVANTTDGTNLIALPADFLDYESLRLDTADVTFVDNESFWAASDEGFTLEEPYPYIARIWKGKIELYPTPPNATDYKLRYIEMPADLSADGDISPLPLEWHWNMAYYAAFRALKKVREDGDADVQYAMYVEGLPPRRSPRSRNRPGQRPVVVQGNTFDNDPEAMHI